MKTINPDIQIFYTVESARKFFVKSGWGWLLSANTGTIRKPETSYFVSKTDLREDWPELYTLIQEAEDESSDIILPEDYL